MSLSSVVHSPIPPRSAPARTQGFVAWARNNLFSDWPNSIATILLLALLGWYVPQLIDWAVLKAVLRPDVDACQATAGACWGVVSEKYRTILFGRYPYAEQWRPLAAVLLMLSLVGVSAVPRMWRWYLLPLWLLGTTLFVVLMGGGVAGLTPVKSNLWGGLPLTVLLSLGGMLLGFPLSILLAMGRRSELPVVRTLSATYVELIRGVPLISVLFMASFMLPLFLPQGVKLDVLIRVLVGIGLFAAAYMAEIVRGGLQSVPRGQVEAAQSLGLGYWKTHGLILLPQALQAVLPSLVNSFIGNFKDCSLVTIVSLYELTGALSLALGGDVVWRPFFLEGYLFVAFIYWIFCFGMSRYSLRIERKLSHGQQRDQTRN
ncbi:amino acid ABC transporter permease [Uliginosibacterium sp. H3]|uniref:Amino acid ABC transporter permease n=1 Tax=Uliginosibacterium silvisoli TaxID=3114758 RepID=A0ABU6K9L9_9RHOO|nr:amino acid ABC transporter permease [Uliginosibacterium sp. H3]